MSYIRKVRTCSGATAVQIVSKGRGEIVKLTHVGSAHTQEELEVLVTIANQKLYSDQLELFPKYSSRMQMGIRKTYSGLLWETLRKEYDRIGFTMLGDEIFEALCLARIAKAMSKIDSLRVLTDLGYDPPNKNKLY